MQQEAAEQQQVLESWQWWAADGPGLGEAGELDSERQVSAMLRQALNKGQKLLEQQQQRWVGGLHSKWGGGVFWPEGPGLSPSCLRHHPSPCSVQTAIVEGCQFSSLISSSVIHCLF